MQIVIGLPQAIALLVIASEVAVYVWLHGHAAEVNAWGKITIYLTLLGLMLWGGFFSGN